MKRRPRPPTIITRVIVFLLLGAIVNVASVVGLVAVQHARLRQEVRACELKTMFESIKSSTIDRNSTGLILVRAHGTANGAANLCGIRYQERISGGQREGELIAGWPFLSNSHHWQGQLSMWSNVGIALVHEILPIRPLWPGFAINTIFYAVILGLLFFAPGSVRRAFRRRRGLCPACAYPIGTSPVCTECGKAVNPVKSVTLSP